MPPTAVLDIDIPADLGTALRRLREQCRIGVREMARRIGMDPANYTRTERAASRRNFVPTDETLATVAERGLGLGPDSVEWRLLFDLAAAARTTLPLDLDRPEVRRTLPGVFAILRREFAITGDERTENPASAPVLSAP